MKSGTDKAWETLSGLDPGEVSMRAKAAYDETSGSFTFASLGREFSIAPGKKEISGLSPEATEMHKKASYFFELAVLWYLCGARRMDLSGKLIRPENLKGGHHFFTGTHELPLKSLARRYGSDRDGFISRGEWLGGKILSYGDASLELYPLPRIPVILIVWLEDDEFPARADLLFDSSCELHAALDILWSAAMMSVIMML